MNCAFLLKCGLLLSGVALIAVGASLNIWPLTGLGIGLTIASVVSFFKKGGSDFAKPPVNLGTLYQPYSPSC